MKIESITQSVDCAEKMVKHQAQSLKREWGENPQRGLSVCASKFLCSSAKAGHWETEKAEYKNADKLCL